MVTENPGGFHPCPPGTLDRQRAAHLDRGELQPDHRMLVAANAGPARSRGRLRDELRTFREPGWALQDAALGGGPTGPVFRGPRFNATDGRVHGGVTGVTAQDWSTQRDHPRVRASRAGNARRLSACCFDPTAGSL